MNVVPRLWPGETVAILAGGPSLTQADVDACRGRVRVLAVKDAIRLAPWADAFYCCGNDVGRWWSHHGPTLTYGGPRFTLDPKAAAFGALVLKNTGTIGLELQPTGLRTGKNSGYQAVNLAVHLGARRILLLGFDMKPGPTGDHWFGPHPYHTAPIPYRDLRELFPTIVEPLKAAGVEVINCTPDSALTCFPCASLADALPCEVAA